jgi:hypothetical protein
VNVGINVGSESSYLFKFIGLLCHCKYAISSRKIHKETIFWHNGHIMSRSLFPNLFSMEEGLAMKIGRLWSHVPFFHLTNLVSSSTTHSPYLRWNPSLLATYSCGQLTENSIHISHFLSVETVYFSSNCRMHSMTFFDWLQSADIISSNRFLVCGA